MARSVTLRSGGKPLFGQAVAPCPERTPDLADELNRRLKEKYRNYERAAMRLELRGDYDSAQVLRRAANRARLLRNRPANDTDRRD